MAAAGRAADLPFPLAATATGRAGTPDAGRATPAPERRIVDGASAGGVERDPDDGEDDDDEVSVGSAAAVAVVARPMTTPAPRAAAKAPTRPTQAAAVTARIISGRRR